MSCFKKIKLEQNNAVDFRHLRYNFETAFLLWKQPWQFHRKYVRFLAIHMSMFFNFFQMKSDLVLVFNVADEIVQSFKKDPCWNMRVLLIT